MTTLSHQIRLDPTVKQANQLQRAAGVARFAWNWGLARWDELYAAGEKPTALKLKVEWNRIKGGQFPWVYDSPKDANQQPFTNLGHAFQLFFQGKAKRPRFKKRGRHDAFYVSNDKFNVDGRRVRLPVIGWVRMREALRFEGKILSGTVSRKADGWYLAVQVELLEDYQRERTGAETVGVDLGVTTAATLSTGEKIDGPKPLKAHLKRLKRAQRRVGRKQKGSNNRKRTVRKAARLHQRIANIRNDWTHKLTTRLCRENQAVVVEDLNVRGMLANHHLARAISDVGFHEVRRQLTYKAPLHRTHLVVVDRWFPSSKLCSDCGAKHEDLVLSDRVFRCPVCEVAKDRDWNAALNLRTAGLAGTYACGPEGSGAACSTKPCRGEAGTMPCSHASTP